ncbi:glycoside hydrolase domain-containing protein [Dysgonomonas sp. 520]|uniref:glycoside hydrolase domain-containing protein n=1 Tax=Dysgonomonas sp. 520 TaxID=2302931 RepID=UPI0013D41F23|nr:hypothetical protein [Dysgonomonas sp. 520]
MGVLGDGGGMSVFVVFSVMGFYPVNSGDTVYTINGKGLNKPFIPHDDIKNGRKLIFTMGNKANKNWGKY